LKLQQEDFKATFSIAIVLSVLFDKWREMTTFYWLVNIRNAIFRRQDFLVAVTFLLVCCEQFFCNFLILMLTGDTPNNN